MVKSLLVMLVFFTVSAGHGLAEAPPEDAPSESRFLSAIRQLTFTGRRAGEGYFNREGTAMVFQSERIAENPFFQIFLMDMETGDETRISPGYGKTTCAWIHPDGEQILFASTHEDPHAKEKQAAELEARATGKERRYSWDYDDHFELYRYDRRDKTTTRITHAKGYDAEGSWSPDGEWIAFTSNRIAYEEQLSPAEQSIFERDKSYFNELYIMRSDGSDLKRLTDSKGYDGGPFFSPDGRRLCWRRFSEDGALAEIMTGNIDGTDPRQVTRLGALSWAPFYHPSGEYLIFTTNRHGFANFELYLIDTQGQSQPVRVTTTDGFDGLPAFTPDGEHLAWTSNRNSAKQSQLYMADWNHTAALQLLGLHSATKSSAADTESKSAAIDPTPPAESIAAATAAANSMKISPKDLLRHVDYLCREDLEGRLTGTAGEKKATAYVAAYMDGLGLQPAGDNGTFFQDFEFTSGISLGEDNRLTWGDTSYQLDQQWRPMAFSSNGEFPASPVVCVGYGIVAPADDDAEPPQPEYDSYVHQDVKGKWVMCFRFLPENITAERRQFLARYSSLRFKAMVARDHGAAGLIIVSGPTSKVKNQLVSLQSDGSLTGSSIPIISITDELAESWLESAGKNLGDLQTSLDDGQPAMGFDVTNVEIAANIELEAIKSTGRNVLGVLRAGDQAAPQTIVVGAHVDHLGRGTGGSLARGDEVNQIHFGADDNASGVAAMLEMAEYLVATKSDSTFEPKRDVLFAAWSGEELGLLGASHFVDTVKVPPHANHETTDEATAGHHAVGDQHGANSDTVTHTAKTKSLEANGHGESNRKESSATDSSIYPTIAACLNLDMVGRFEKRLVLQGIGSSSVWKSEIERRNAPVGLPITLQNDCYLPTDASAFFMRGVPILAAFTGSHSEYHTPRDTPDKLNYDDAARIAKFMALVTRSLASADSPPDFQDQERPQEDRPRAGLRAYLGTIPDYAQSDLDGAKGVLLSGVSKDGPAAKAGVQGGDRVVRLAAKKIENIYDYTYAIDALKIGQAVEIIVIRDGKKMTFSVTPGSRE